MARGKVSPRYSPKRDGSDGDGGDENAWLGTYGDMITLLMAFFVMLYAISQVDQVKFQAFVQGLNEPFGNRTAVGMVEGGATVIDGAGSPQVTGVDANGLMITPPPVAGEEPSEEQETEPADEETEPADDATESDEQGGNGDTTLAAIAEKLREALEAEGLPVDVAEVRPDERGVVISVASDDVLFALGSADISRLGQRIVRAVASILDEVPNEVIVEGHTDDLPLQRRDGYDNWNLSTDRSVAVLQLLADNGVGPQRLIASGYGEHRPRVPNDSRRNRALNRRVDVVLVANPQPVTGATDG